MMTEFQCIQDCNLLDPNGLISLIMPPLAIQANKYVSPVFEGQFFTSKRVFSDRFTLMIPIYRWFNQPHSHSHE